MLSELQRFCLAFICLFIGFYIGFFLIGVLRIVIHDLFDF